jgi:outer membrane lipoprotein carrier protein
MRRWSGAAVTVIAFLFFIPGLIQAAAEDPVKEIVNKVETRYRKATDLIADFTQTTTVKGFATALKSAGRVYIKRPGKLRWDYLEPNLEQIFVNNDRVQFYVPEHKQVLTGQLSKMADSQAPLQLLQGIGRMDKHYTVAALPGGAKGGGRLPLLSLTPVEGGEDQPRIVVEVDPDTYFLRRVELHDVNGSVSNFVFSKIQANTGLKDELFVFQVPKDVEVIPAQTLAGP